MLTGNAIVELFVGDWLPLEAVADAELAEDLVLPDVRHVVLTQQVQLWPDMQPALHTSNDTSAYTSEGNH